MKRVVELVRIELLLELGHAFVGLALVGLTLHELFTERVVHSIEVHAPAPEHELAGASA